VYYIPVFPDKRQNIFVDCLLFEWILCPRVGIPKFPDSVLPFDRLSIHEFNAGINRELPPPAVFVEKVVEDSVVGQIDQVFDPRAIIIDIHIGIHPDKPFRVRIFGRCLPDAYTTSIM
jgi:hypothetical protein